ncbi:MAG: hypothetical protein IPM68_14690 [Flavobacteriales bacterium]|nr:hypothetical protein [Flavobacteriales bacterium]
MDLRQRVLDAIVQDNPVSKDYVEFRCSRGKDIGRAFPQVEHTFFDPPINDSSWQDLSKYPAQGDFSGRVIMKRSAKVTDFLSSYQTGMGLIMSARAMEVVEQFSIGQYKAYPIACEYRNERYDYWFLALDIHLLDVIDYESSVFYTRNLHHAHMADVAFSSRADYDTRFRELQVTDRQQPAFREGLVECDIEPKRLYVCAGHQDLDVVDWYGRFFFSVGLSTAIKTHGLTGVEMRECRTVYKAGTK